MTTHPHRRAAAKGAARAIALAMLAGALTLALAASCGGDGDAAPAVTPEAAVAATASRAAATPTATPKRTEITFMAGFRAQANLPFVAAYVADAKGFFAEEGLRVQIQHSSGQDEHLKLLLDDKVQFTTGTAAQLLRRREDKLPVTGVALFGQRGDQAYVTRADSGIRGPADFKGRSVGFKAGVIPAELEAMLASVGLITKDVKTQAVGFDPRVFIEGQVDVYPVFINNEPYTIRKAGVAINVIDPANFGVPTLGVVFLANDRTVRDDPELVRRFLRATLRAAAWAERNVDEAVQITLKWAPGADAEHQRFLLTTDIENARRADGIGRADVAQWRALQSVLRRYGVLESDADLSGAFDQSFVDGLHAVGAIIADAPRGRS